MGWLTSLSFEFNNGRAATGIAGLKAPYQWMMLQECDNRLSQPPTPYAMHNMDPGQPFGKSPVEILFNSGQRLINRRTKQIHLGEKLLDSRSTPSRPRRASRGRGRSLLALLRSAFEPRRCHSNGFPANVDLHVPATRYRGKQTTSNIQAPHTHMLSHLQRRRHNRCLRA